VHPEFILFGPNIFILIEILSINFNSSDNIINIFKFLIEIILFKKLIIIIIFEI